MAIIEIHGDLFDLTYASGYALGHGVNTKGKMGAGIAKPFADKFPNMFYTYKQLCDHGMLLPGMIQAWRENGVYGYNIASQSYPGAFAKYDWLYQGVSNAMNHAYHEDDIHTLVLPRIGCGIGGLTWDRAKVVLDQVSNEYQDMRLVVVTPRS